MTETEFRELVTQGIEAIPKKFLDLLDNVAIVIADRPSRRQVSAYRLKHTHALLGLYEGIPRSRRNSGYSGVLPDKITIFKEPIEALARTEEEIAEIVRDTVWHEIAHHFGMDEPEVRAAEQQRRRRS